MIIRKVFLALVLVAHGFVLTLAGRGVVSAWSPPALDVPVFDNEEIIEVYVGKVGIKQPEGFSACSFTGDFAEGVAKMRRSGAVATVALKGEDSGVRTDLSCPIQGWSGDLHWSARFEGGFGGAYDGSGTVDEILTTGFLAASFSYEWRNCSGSCPEPSTAAFSSRPMTVYGQFLDDELTIASGTIIDEFNVTWGRWSADFVGSSPIASVETVRPSVLVNGSSVGSFGQSLEKDDVLSLRFTDIRAYPHARLTCTLGESSGDVVDYKYLPSDVLIQLISGSTAWEDYSPQIVSDWPAFCGFAARVGDQGYGFSQHLQTGAVLVSTTDPGLLLDMQTPTVGVGPDSAATFLLAYNPDTDASLVAAFGGTLHLTAVNESVGSFTLNQGQAIVVERDQVSFPIALPQVSLPIVVRP